VNELRPVVFLPIAALVIVSCRHSSRMSSDITAPAVTICDIVSAPEAYDGRRVAFDARILSDGMEHTVLLDDACPKNGIVPIVSAENESEADMVALRNAIHSGRPGTIEQDNNRQVHRCIQMASVRDPRSNGRPVSRYDAPPANEVICLRAYGGVQPAQSP
jgi:hypothetical protein